MMHPVRVVLAALLIIGVSAAGAQDYPSRLVTIIVPYPAGGPTDQVARELAASFSEKLNQNFVVENVSGGGTTIATGRVARAAPDGYTLLLHNLQISANVALYPHLGFDTEKDLTPVGFINQNPLVLTGRKSLHANTLTELLALMRQEQLKMAHPGTGSTGHLATSLFLKESNLEAIQVPYRGAAPALQDLAGDHVDLFFATPQSVVEQVAAGQIKAFGITAKQESPLFPKVASLVAEIGPKLEILYWHALFVPGGTPAPVIDKLNEALQQVEEESAIVDSWEATGVRPYPKDQRSSQAAQRLLHSEIARWARVVLDNNIQPSGQ
jgi:tripartite-type tricarboxylate transporter receptor subunit TctC